MSDPTGGAWSGEDRRRSDPKLEQAMSEVRHLYGSVEELALAVSRSVPRDEIEAREREHKERERQFREQARLMVAGFVALFVLLFAFSMWQVGRLEHKLDSGHDVILCAMKVPAGSLTDIAILTCKQASK
jgi:hypothetical protein